MTEEEWLSAEFSDPLLRFIEPKVTDRKLHCYAIACARRIAQLLVDPSSLHGVEVMERFVEGQCTADEMRQLSWDVEGAAFAVQGGIGVPFLHLADQLPHSFISELVANNTYSFQSARDILTSAAYFVDAIFSPEPWERRKRLWPPNAQGSIFRPVPLVHEVFGNPFRPVSFSPEWRTSTAVAIAKSMYDSRDFAPMPLLADALQDAGCEHADILDHCREANGTHVRGCWVVDLVLGKS
jgi:hypothetical protein